MSHIRCLFKRFYLMNQNSSDVEAASDLNNCQLYNVNAEVHYPTSMTEGRCLLAQTQWFCSQQAVGPAANSTEFLHSTNTIHWLTNKAKIHLSFFRGTIVVQWMVENLGKRTKRAAAVIRNRIFHTEYIKGVSKMFLGELTQRAPSEPVPFCRQK